jgi:hypothetical protein
VQGVNIDTNTHILFGTQRISARLKSKPDGNEGSEIDPVTHHKKILTEFLRFYRALHGFSGGDVAFMNHWLNVKNKRFGVLPRELLLTCEGIQRLNQYFEGLTLAIINLRNRQFARVIYSFNGMNAWSKGKEARNPTLLIMVVK